MSNWIDVLAVDDLSPGSYQVVEVEGAPVLLFNLNGEYFAIAAICTHEYGELADGGLDGEEIICPLHGARFSIRTGAVLAPPAYENLRTYPVRVTDGWIEVDAEAEAT